MLKNNRIKLRAVEPQDVDYLLSSENDTSHWYVSETLIPFSRNTLKKYAESVHDLKTQEQFRFVIEELQSKVPIGMIDLFNYDSINQRAGVGIVITAEEKRNQGIASDALRLLIEYARDVLYLKQLYCSIHESNHRSVNLFESLNFANVGKRKDWYRVKDGWEAELLFQLILTK